MTDKEIIKRLDDIRGIMCQLPYLPSKDADKRQIVVLEKIDKLIRDLEKELEGESK